MSLSNKLNKLSLSIEENSSKIDPYYMQRDNFELKAIIPALSSTDINSFSYYTVPHKENPEERFSPVFLYTNPKILSFEDVFNQDDLSGPNYICLLDSEISSLWNFNYTDNNIDSCVKTRSESFLKDSEYISNHPTILYFKGCDDGHMALRFKNENEAILFLNSLDVFEDILKSKIPLIYDN